ncbi:hypothetical protein ACK1HZ_004904, partial [Salmonella enterica]
MARASVKQKCFPGLSLFWPSGNPSDRKVEGTRNYSTVFSSGCTINRLLLLTFIRWLTKKARG